MAAPITRSIDITPQDAAKMGFWTKGSFSFNFTARVSNAQEKAIVKEMVYFCMRYVDGVVNKDTKEMQWAMKKLTKCQKQWNLHSFIMLF